jgi:hypothetical protein
LNFFFKTETGSNQPVSIWFGLFFGQKPVQTGLTRVFFCLARFFFDLGSVRFHAYKTETEPVDVFKILIDFFTV